MNYSLLTEQSINNRFNTVPDTLREALESPQTQKTIRNVSKTQFLNEEKSLILEQLVSLVLLGFLSPQELVHELREQLFLNHEHARVLAKELEDRVFEPVREELAASYNPLGGVTEQREEEEESPAARPMPVAEASPEAPLPVAALKIEAEPAAPIEKPVPVATTVEGGPVVLQKEVSFFERAEPKPAAKRPAFSFTSFASSAETSEKPRVQAKVETPLGRAWAPEKKEEPKGPKVVHYGESRPATGLGAGPVSEFINLEALRRVSSSKEGAPKPSVEEKKSPLMWTMPPLSVGTPAVTAAAPAKPIDTITSASKPTPEKGGAAPSVAGEPVQPSLSGNVIHLR